MRSRRSVAAALVGLALPFVPAIAHASPAPPKPLTAADLPRLTQQLAQVTAHAEALSDELDTAAARDGGLRADFAQLDEAQQQAQDALDARARAVYVGTTTSPLAGWQMALAAPEARILAERANASTLTIDRSLVTAVSVQRARVDRLQVQANAFRASLQAKARSVLAEEDQAYQLFEQVQALAVAEHNAQLQAQLAAQAQQLDEVSTAVALSLTPAQTARAKAALSDQAPIVALLEQSGGAIPVGYVSTGQSVTGIASWYGPGFDGHPTASGAPYDSQRLTCANKELPLGTVIHVTANGYATNCLVNDRGPYVGNRILDMSRAGSRALGYDGLAQVTITVLTTV